MIQISNLISELHSKIPNSNSEKFATLQIEFEKDWSGQQSEKWKPLKLFLCVMECVETFET